MTVRRLAAALLAVALLAAAPASAEIIGRVARLRQKVTAFPAGQPARDLREQDPVERGLKVRLTETAYLKVALNFGGFETRSGPWTGRVAGSASLSGRGEVDFGDPATIRLILGQLVLALLPGAQRSVQVETPDAIVQVDGTFLRILVHPVVGTFVAVDEGSVTVRSKSGGASVSMGAGHWTLVPPGGAPASPAILEPLDGSAGRKFPDLDIAPDPPLLDPRDPSVEPPKARPPERN